MAFPRIEGYVVTEKLGTGSYSTVYKAYTKVGARSIVAVKCIDKSRIKHSGAAVDNLVTEIRLLKTLTHPHIVHMKEFTWDDKNIYIIMEYCCGGDLSKYIRRYGCVPEKQVLYFLQQLASALKFLREKGVVHMDLKPHNLLLHKNSDGKYMLKVADFGFAQHMSEDNMRSVRGSPLYMAPEMIAGKYDARVDLWSVGVIMYECLFGKAPYSSATFKELVDKIERKDPIRIPPNAAVSPGCLDLLTRLLQHDPDKRISYDEFFNHEYLDLENMPSKENYDKAVALIKQAVELDARGELRAALDAYAAALRRLVPAARVQPDATRRHALQAKLHSYMERAEEIKAYLEGTPHLRGIQTIQSSQETPPPPSPPATVPRRGGGGGACCVAAAGAGGNSCSYDFSNSPRNQTCPCNCLSQQGSVNGVCSCRHQKASNGLDLGDIGTKQAADTSSESSKNSTEPAVVTKPRGAIARFLRRAPLPYLHAKDDVAEESNSDKSQKATDDTANDACRIT